MTALAVLTCAKCAAPIPFGAGETAVCPFCSAETEVPAAYREMRDAGTRDAALRAEAEHVLRRLDRPPWLATKILARVFDQPMFVFWLIFGVPVGLASIIWSLRFTAWIAPQLGYRSADDVPFWITTSMLFGIIFMMVFVPRVLGIFANRRVSSRMRLLAALAARLPTTEGGPAECRSCGAPLDVHAGDLLATCAYCGSDNAVQLRTKFVTAATHSVVALGSTIHGVAEADRAERRRTRRLLLHELFRYLWPLAIFAPSIMAVDVPVLGPVMMVITVGLLIGLMLRSMAHMGERADEAEQRRAGNDVPKWVGTVGSLAALFLIWLYWAHC